MARSVALSPISSRPASRATSATAVLRTAVADQAVEVYQAALSQDVHDTLELLLTRMSRALVQHRDCGQLARDNGAVYRTLAALFASWSTRQAAAAALYVSPSCLDIVVQWCMAQLIASPPYATFTEAAKDEAGMTAVIDALVVSQAEVESIFVDAVEKGGDTMCSTLANADQCARGPSRAQSLQAALDLCRQMNGVVGAGPRCMVRYVRFTAAVATLVPAMDMRELVDLVAHSVIQAAGRQQEACASCTEAWLVAAICRSWATIDALHSAALREVAAAILLPSASSTDGGAELLELIHAALRQPTLDDGLAHHGTDPVLSLDLPGRPVDAARRTAVTVNARRAHPGDGARETVQQTSCTS